MSSRNTGRPTIPGFSELFGEYRPSGTPEPHSYEPSRSSQDSRQGRSQHPSMAGYPPSMMPRGGVPGPSGVAPYPSGPLQSHPAAQYAGYPSGSPVSTGYHQPQFVSHPTPMPGGQFSILRTSHGAQPLSVASSSATYGGLSGNVRPLRQNEFSQYAVEQTTVDGRVEVRYRCQECGKGFDRPSSLKTHMTSHSGERPHACPFAGCGRRFGVSSNMHRHVRTAHGGGGGLGTLSGDEDGFGEDQDA